MSGTVGEPVSDDTRSELSWQASQRLAWGVGRREDQEDALSEIDRLRAEVAALRDDAHIGRWVREHAVSMDSQDITSDIDKYIARGALGYRSAALVAGRSYRELADACCDHCRALEGTGPWCPCCGKEMPGHGVPEPSAWFVDYACDGCPVAGDGDE